MRLFSFDLFSSDQRFIQAASGLLIVCGLGALLFVLMCRLLPEGFCQMNLIPLFGGIDVFRTELAEINLPLAMLIIGIGMRLYTPFGWGTAVLIATLLGVAFVALSIRLNQETTAYWAQVSANPQLVIYPSLIESLIVDMALAVLAWSLVGYMLLPTTRRLYWRKASATSPADASS